MNLRCKLITCNGKEIMITCETGLFGFSVNQKILLEAISKYKIEPENVKFMELSAENIEVAWGFQFKMFIELKELKIIARQKVRINCFNFEGTSIESITLAGNEISFNDGAFMNAEELQTVYIQGSISNGQHGGLTEVLFKNCRKLVRVQGSYRGDKVMPCLFENCSELKWPLDLHVKELGFRTFAECTSLKEIHLHNGLEDMGHAAFENCSSLENFYVPDTVKNLGTNTFSGCKNLKSVHLPENIRNIPSGFFKDCMELKKCYIPNSVESIETSAFEGCSSLVTPFMPSGLRKIGAKAFWGCKEIKSIYIPRNVSEIGEEAFGQCCGIKIKGERGSFAQEYAVKYNIEFIEMGEV